MPRPSHNSLRAVYPPGFWVLWMGALLLGLGLAGDAFAPSLLWHMLAVAVWSLGEIVGYSIGKTVIAELGRPNVRGRSTGLVGSMSGLGTLAGPLIGSWRLSHYENVGPRLSLKFGGLKL